MANYPITDILRSQVTTKVVTRMAQSSSRLLSLHNMGPGQSQENPQGHRTGGYDIFNNTRSVGTTSAPGTPANRIAPQKVGRVDFTFARMYESLFMPYEKLHNLRKIGGPVNTFDEMGVSYVTKQEAYLGQRVANWRTIMLVGMLRDSLYLFMDGNTPYFKYDSASALGRVNFQMPTGNKSQLNMLGNGNIIDVPWDNPGADIPGQLEAIDQAFTALCGQRLEQVTVSGYMWSRNIIKNDAVLAGAGIANKPFSTYDRVVGAGPDGTPLTDKVGRLEAIPWVEFLITNDGVDVGAAGSETYTQHVPDTGAFFGPRPQGRNDLFEMLLGDEPVVEYDGGPASVQMGLHTWAKNSSDPAGHTLFALDNAMPAMYVPNSYAFGTVTGF